MLTYFQERNAASAIARKLMLAATLTSLLALTACAGMEERLSRIGQDPAMSSIQTPQNHPGYNMVNFPMPETETVVNQPNSLWESSRQTFFKDQRAHKTGDILTVLIDMEDTADWENKTQRTRDGTETTGIPNFFGLESKLKKVLPSAVDPTNLVGINSDEQSTGDGKIKRTEAVKLKLSAMITQVLPNGNFVVRGQQEVRVNSDLRQLTLDGIIRPEDILNNNSISYEKIAEARISYGGKGELMDIQQPRYGQQLYDAISPF